MEERCVICGEPLPTECGKQYCWQCELAILKMGTLLQSQDAPKETVKKAYEEMCKDIKLSRG